MGFRGMTLIITSIFILAGPGILFNNLNNSGLVQAQSLNCPGYPDITCQGSVSVGCQATSNYFGVAISNQCSLSASAISFLNNQSPFTLLLAGNYGGLWSALTTSSNAFVNQGPFDPWGAGQVLYANCEVATGATTLLSSLSLRACTQTNSLGLNMTKGNTTITNEWNTAINTLAPTSNLHFYGWTTNITSSLGTEFVCDDSGPYQSVNYTAATGTAKGNGYTLHGCDFAVGHGVGKTFSQFGMLISVPEVLLPYSAFTHINVFVKLIDYSGFYCADLILHGVYPSTGIGNNQACLNLNSDMVNLYKSSSNPNGIPIIGPFLMFLAGLALLFIGLGIDISAGGSIIGTGTQFGLGSNRQGTKFAQVLGLGLVVWSFMYSQFSTWFTSGLLPYGLDGSLGIIGVSLTGLFFFGVFDQATTG